MFFKNRFPELCLLLVALLVTAVSADASPGCVWKVTGPTGGTLYLGGSVHALKSSDYPLPAAYNRAFDASERIVFEVEPKALSGFGDVLLKAGHYPKGDSLKNHVDPRTYDYLRRIFALMKIPESKYSQCRPWLLVLLLDSPQSGVSDELGVDEFLTRRAQANSKPAFGLETVREHSAVFSGLTDKQSEALLLINLIPQSGGDDRSSIMAAWRRGDVDALARLTRASFADFPAFGVRIIGARNRNWMPKVEEYLRGGKTCFVVVGAAHLGGGDGLLALLRARGYRLEKL
ncbi:MAG: uncharacterized protein QOG27_1878 [Verrucomicrobiota bacterium]